MKSDPPFFLLSSAFLLSATKAVCICSPSARSTGAEVYLHLSSVFFFAFSNSWLPRSEAGRGKFSYCSKALRYWSRELFDF